RRKPAQQDAPPVSPRPPVTTRVLSPFQTVWRWVQAAFSALDHAFSWFAIPFGVRVLDPGRRYTLMLGMFAVIYLVGAFVVHPLALVALGFGYIGVLAIGRAWVLNEKERTAIAKKLKDGNPDEMPDLRWAALVSALQLLILFPLLFQQVQWQYHLFR